MPDSARSGSLHDSAASNVSRLGSPKAGEALGSGEPDGSCRRVFVVAVLCPLLDHDGDAGGQDQDRDQEAEIASLLATSRKNVRKETAKMRFPAPLKQGSTADKQQTWILDKLQFEAAVFTSDYTRAHVILAFSDQLDKIGGRFKEFTSNELIDAWTEAGGTFDEYYLRSERLMGGVDQNARVAYITFISAALCAPIMEYLRIALPGVIREIPDSADPLRASKLLRLADEQLDPKSAKQLHVARAVHLLMTACNNSEQLSSNTARHVETIDFHQREVQRLAGPIFPDSLIKISVLGALSVTGTIWASRVPIYEQALSRDAAWAAERERYCLLQKKCNWLRLVPRLVLYRSKGGSVVIAMRLFGR